MRKRLLSMLAAGALLTVAPAFFAAAQKAKPAAKPASDAKAAPVAASAPLTALFEAYSEEHARLFPVEGLYLGDMRYNDQFPNDQTRAFREQQRRSYQQYLATLHKMNRTSLSADDRVSYDIFDYLLTDQLDGLKQNSWMVPFAQFFSVPNALPLLGSGTGAQPFKTVRDYDNWLARAHGFPVWADSAIANFRVGMKAGVVLPKTLVLKTIPQLEALAVTDPTKTLFYGPITKLPASFSEADKTRLTTAYQQAIATDLTATYQKLAAFLKTEYLPLARATAGLGALAGGPAAYRYLVRSQTTTEKIPRRNLPDRPARGQAHPSGNYGRESPGRVPGRPTGFLHLPENRAKVSTLQNPAGRAGRLRSHSSAHAAELEQAVWPHAQNAV